MQHYTLFSLPTDIFSIYSLLKLTKRQIYTFREYCLLNIHYRYLVNNIVLPEHFPNEFEPTGKEHS